MKNTRLIILILFALIVLKGKLLANADSVQFWSQQSFSKTDSTAAFYNYKLGEWYARGGSKFDSALICLDKALIYYLKENNEKKVGTCHYLMGIAYANMRDKENAIDKFVKAEKSYIKIKDTSKIIFALEAQAFALTPEERIRVYNKTLAMARSAGLIQNEITILGNLARALNNKNMRDSSIVLLKKQYQLLLTQKDTDPKIAKQNKTRLQICTKSLGHDYYRKSNYDLALKYYNEAYKLGKEIDPNYSGLTNVVTGINLISYNWKRQNRQAHDRAFKNVNLLKLLRDGQRIAIRSQSLSDQNQLAESFSYYFKDQGNIDSVFHYQNLWHKLSDSMASETSIKASAKFAEELKTADKEKEIIQLNADKKIAAAKANRNKIIFILILLGLLTSAYFIYKRIKYRNLKEQEERDKNFRSKLSSDLHDDVGTILTSLSMQSELLEMKASEDNKETVGKIAGMSRDATRRMRDTVWAIDSRKDNIMDLAYRMIDFAEDILQPKDVEFQLEHNIENKDDKISAELRQNIFLIFKEALTNAAKYGNGELVTAKLKKESDKLNLAVSNQTESVINLDEASGLGLSNIKKRTTELNGSFSIANKDNSFDIQLSFPL